MASRAPTSHPPVRRNLFPQPSAGTQPRSASQVHVRTASASSSSTLPVPSGTLISAHLARRAPTGATVGTASCAGRAGASAPMYPPFRATASAASSSADTVREASLDEDEEDDEDDDDIVIRDGGDALEGRGGFALEMDGEVGGEVEDEEEAAGKVDTRMIELYRSHSRQHIDPGELRAVVQASLREKAASLDKDRWMYEAEDEYDAQG